MGILLLVSALYYVCTTVVLHYTHNVRQSIIIKDGIMFTTQHAVLCALSVIHPGWMDRRCKKRKNGWREEAEKWTSHYGGYQSTSVTV